MIFQLEGVYRGEHEGRGDFIINSMFTHKFQFCKTMMLEKFMNDIFSSPDEGWREACNQHAEVSAQPKLKQMSMEVKSFKFPNSYRTDERVKDDDVRN